MYDCELEKADIHNEFLDFCETFDLERGKDDDDEESNIIGQFKVGALCLYHKAHINYHDIMFTMIEISSIFMNVYNSLTYQSCWVLQFDTLQLKISLVLILKFKF